MAPQDESQEDYDIELDSEFFDENGNLWPECGMGPDDQCSMAGSEDCDECPQMSALERRNRLNRPKGIL